MKKTSIELITEERKRQVTEKKYTAVHDSQHDKGEIAYAAACYAVHPLALYEKVEYQNEVHFVKARPFDGYDIDNKKTQLRKLVIAGALIVAEMDRIRKSRKKKK